MQSLKFKLFKISENGEELIIAAVSRQDQGIFSCMAGNAVGSMTAEANLQVQFSQIDAIDRYLSQQKLETIVNEASQNVDRFLIRQFHIIQFFFNFK